MCFLQYLQLIITKNTSKWFSAHSSFTGIRSVNAGFAIQSLCLLAFHFFGVILLLPHFPLFLSSWFSSLCIFRNLPQTLLRTSEYPLVRFCSVYSHKLFQQMIMFMEQKLNHCLKLVRILKYWIGKLLSGSRREEKEICLLPPSLSPWFWPLHLINVYSKGTQRHHVWRAPPRPEYSRQNLYPVHFAPEDHMVLCGREFVFTLESSEPSMLPHPRQKIKE